MKTMKIFSTILCAMLLTVLPATAQTTDNKNKAVIETAEGQQQLNTDEISVIRFDGGKITIVQPWGETFFDRTLRSLTFQRSNPNTLRLTASTTIGTEGSGNRAQSIDGEGKLKSTWEDGDVVYVYPDASSTENIGTLTPKEEDWGKSSATLSGDIDATDLPANPTLYFSTKDRSTLDLSSQDGTVESLFYFVASAEVTIVGGNATISNLTFERPIAIVKFTLKDKATNDAINATQLTVTTGATTINVTPSSATDELYVGIPAISSQAVSLSANITPCYVYAYEKASASFADNKYYAVNVKMTKQYVDLSRVTSNFTAADGDELRGTLANNVKISIAAGATVRLSGVNINGSGTWTSGKYGGLNCLGDATIFLADGTINTVKGFREDYPGIHIPENYTLTIQGTGSVNASSNGSGAGIGGGLFISCGHITILSGTVTATGGSRGAGIGGGDRSSCGNITINGGTITATGGTNAAGIGSGGNYGGSGSSSCGSISITGGTVEATGVNFGAGIGGGDRSSCGDITIMNTVTRVTATKGGSAPNSIGAGYDGTCGTVTIGGVVGAISESPYTFPVGTFTINSSGNRVYFAPGNLQYQASTSTWRFAEHQWDYLGDANSAISSSNTGWIDLFGWGTSGISGYTPIATCYQPYSTSTSYGEYNPYGSTSTNLYDGGDNAGKADWGYAANAANLGGHNTWRTLKDGNTTGTNEWEYIFNRRTTGITVNGTENARYTVATINTDGTGVNGIILFPDNYTGPTSSTDGITFDAINNKSYWKTKCTSAGWAVLENAGCVFLPAAGERYITDPINVGLQGYYWSSSCSTYYSAYILYFDYGTVSPKETGYRYLGFSVRLVRPLE